MDIGMIVVAVITAVIGFCFGAFSSPKVKTKKENKDNKGGEK